jgi:5'-nucleotidase
MRILITNDDGIYSPGIFAIAGELAKEHSVTVVAPDVQRSACGHAITMNIPLTVEKHRMHGMEGLEAYVTNGTPADCVKLALAQLMKEKPDLVISGINKGPNVATDILYSGTVSAAIEGAVLGCPSVALSIDSHMPEYYGDTALFFSRFIAAYDILKLPRDIILNINLPDMPLSEIKGVAAVPQGLTKYTDEFAVRNHPRGYTYYWLAGELVPPEEGGQDTDIKLLRKGYAVMTPLKYNLTDFEYLQKLHSDLKNFRLQTV